MIFLRWRTTYARRYLPCFVVVLGLTQVAGGVAVVQLYHLISALLAISVLTLYFWMLAISSLLCIATFALAFGRPAAARYLASALLLFFAIGCITRVRDGGAMFEHAFMLPALGALWLMNTRRYRVFCLKLAVLRRRRIQYRITSLGHKIKRKASSQRMRTHERQ